MQVRGALWKQYKSSDTVYNALVKVYSKIDGGYFKLVDVSRSAAQLCALRASLCVTRLHRATERQTSVTLP